MPNELKIRLTVDYKKGDALPQKIRTFQTISVSGTNVKGLSVQAIGTSKENLEQPTDLGTLGWVFLHNLDPTNFVAFGDDADAPSIKLLAGESCFVRWNSTDVSAKADTAECAVEFLMLED